MKKIQVLLFFVSLCSSVHGQQAHELIVSINNAKPSNQGRVVFLLFDQEDGFPREVSKAAYSGTLENYSPGDAYTFKNVPSGKYAVTVFLDENRNGQIDSNFMGMPKEPVGASRWNKFGKPKFDKCVFEFRESKQVLEVGFLNN